MKVLEIVRAAYRRTDSERLSEDSQKSDIHIKVSTALILGGASVILTVLNIINRNWFMTGTTAVLSVGFALCAVLSGIFRKRAATSILMAFLCAAVFSIYALTGENEGFAILWTLLVPAISMSLIGLRAGTALSVYFLVFLFAMFSPPMRGLVPDVYTETFQIRFPVLYLTSFASALILSIQKEFYFRKTEQMAYRDAMTGLFNRRYYDLMKSRAAEHPSFSLLTFVSLDINRLKYTNDTLGHRAGDELITGAADCIRKAFPDAEAVCRIGGDEFAVITYAQPDAVRQQIEVLRDSASSFTGTYITEILLSLGWASAAEHPGFNIGQLEKAADTAMYADKDHFYETSGLTRRK